METRISQNWEGSLSCERVVGRPFISGAPQILKLSLDFRRCRQRPVAVQFSAVSAISAISARELQIGHRAVTVRVTTYNTTEDEGEMEHPVLVWTATETAITTTIFGRWRHRAAFNLRHKRQSATAARVPTTTLSSVVDPRRHCSSHTPNVYLRETGHSAFSGLHHFETLMSPFDKHSYDRLSC